MSIGERGPAGHDGHDGEQGEQGIQGERGESTFGAIRTFYREHQDEIALVYGTVLIIVAVAVALTAFAVKAQSDDTARRAAETQRRAKETQRVTRVSCLRSRKYGPYLAKAYATDFDRRPGPEHVFRLMPLSAALAYKASIPKACPPPVKD